jgi:hypothetical protein
MVEGVARVGIASDFEQAKQEFRNSFDRMRR